MEPTSTLDGSASVIEGLDLSHRVWDEDLVKRDGKGRFSSIAALRSKIENLQAALDALRVKQDQELVDLFGSEILTTPFQTYVEGLPSSEQNQARINMFETFSRQVEEQAPITEPLSAAEEELKRRTGVEHSNLKHYGIPGMKWGIRRANPSSGGGGSSTSSQKKLDLSEDFVKTAALRSKRPAELSNQEMRQLVERINLEKQYRDATTVKTTTVKTTTVTLPPSRKAKVAKFVGDLMIDIGKTEVRRVAKGQAAISVERALKKGGQKKLARRITPGGGKKKQPKPPLVYGVPTEAQTKKK